MSKDFFFAKDELKELRDTNKEMFDDQKEYKKGLTQFILSGLKSLGYENTLEKLKGESGMSISEPFDADFLQFIRELKFSDAIGYLNLPEHKNKLNEETRKLIIYNLLKMKYVKALKLGDSTLAAFLIQNDLKEHTQFQAEKKALASLYLTKDNELAEKFGIDIDNKDHIESFINDLKFIVNKNKGIMIPSEPFDYMIRNVIANQLINCEYHKGKHSKAQIDVSEPNLFALKGLEHKCELEPVPTMVHQEIPKLADKVVKVMLRPDSKEIYALMENSHFICFNFVDFSNEFKLKWESDELATFDIVNWTISFAKNTIIVATDKHHLLLLNLEDGTLLNRINDAHEDTIENIIAFKMTHDFITTSCDGSVKWWKTDENTSHKKRKVGRINLITINKAENKAFLVGANKRHIDEFNLKETEIKPKVITVSGIIKNMCLSPNEMYLLVDVNGNKNCIALFKTSNYERISTYDQPVGSELIQKSFFLSNHTFFSETKSGKLVYWHTTNPIPFKTVDPAEIKEGEKKDRPLFKINQPFLVTTTDDNCLRILQ